MKFKNLSNNIPLLISLTLFIASLTQTAFQINSNDPTNKDASAFMTLIVGWVGIFEMPYGLPWFANPLLLLSWIFYSKNIKVSLLLSFLSICFSAMFLLYKKMPENEGGGTSDIIGIGSGYWLWLSSCISFFLISLVIALLMLLKKSKAVI